ncbi:hypothetical protein SAMN02745121_06639 [Nannocystis exedens]|uniref:Secreted protein n=1 Tax=Nannocystis exedens TaxID=54 RepID=A0A1I2FF14_9BACT|nr:hypothetical protein [Nannocystis exedens]PCC70453.1 hypothetical protein NAEX_03496 [Nannocystis exedens]SFF04094.1 hypothetical protein SAMN02745121_06639 [Nannocystis exedens]
MRPVHLLGGLAALCSFFSGGRADAASFFHHSIPASACQPDQASAPHVALVDGSWAYSGTSTNPMTFYCPVTHPFFDHASAEDQVIDGFRLYYRDLDGSGVYHQVTAQLFTRGPTAGSVSPIDSVLSSNSGSNGNNYVDLDITDHTMSQQPYFFKVTIDRNTIVADIAFHGIDIFDNGV